jgi:DnaJ-class molecular chaperone
LFEQARRQGGVGAGQSPEDLIDSEVLESLFGRRQRRRARRAPVPEVISDLTVDWTEAARGVERELTLTSPSGQKRSLKVRVPAGVREGGQIRLRGQADGGADLVLRIHVNEHPDLRREGEDLLLELPISVAEAYRGAQIEVPTPDGSVKLRVPKGVRGGSRLRLKGKGVRRGETTGDLLVQVHIVLPEAEEAGELVDRLEQLYARPVRGEKAE